jgi:hypothetical protein
MENEALPLSLRYQCGLEDFPGPSVTPCEMPLSLQEAKDLINWQLDFLCCFIFFFATVSPQVFNLFGLKPFGAGGVALWQNAYLESARLYVQSPALQIK